MDKQESKIRVERKIHYPNFFRATWSLANRDLKKWYLSPAILIISMVQPIIWLALFGKAFNLGALFTSVSSGATAAELAIFGTTSYFSYLALGMLAFMAISTSMMGGMSIVWDRRFGFVDKILTAPITKLSIIVGKILNSVIRALAQAVVLLIIAIVLGMTLTYFTITSVLTAFAALFLLSFGMSSLFVLLALRARDWQSQMMIINLLMLPLLFASNAFFPLSIMPSWLQTIASWNPVSYAISIGRSALLGPSYTPLASNLMSFLYLGIFAVGMTAITVILSRRLLKG